MIIETKSLAWAAGGALTMWLAVRQHPLIAEGINIDTVTVLGAFASVAGVVGILFKLLIGSKDAQIAANAEAHKLALAQLAAEKLEEESRKKSYQEIADDLLKYSRDRDDWERKRDGRPPVAPLVPVISESHSPSTAAQRETADIASKRAEVVRLHLLAGFDPPRIEPEHAIEPVVPKEGVAGIVEKVQATIKDVDAAVTKIEEAVKEVKSKK